VKNPKGEARCSWFRWSRFGWCWFSPVCLIAIWVAGVSAEAQTCQTTADMEGAARTEIEAAARRYFDMAARGDTSGLAQNSIPDLAAHFAAVESAVKESQPAFSQAQPTIRSSFLLSAEGKEPLTRAEFLCGVFGPNGQTSNSSVFVLNNLPPGNYGAVIWDAKASQGSHTLTLILEEIGGSWKLAGFFARESQINGHDGAWFAQRAKEFKAKGQNRSAWFYFRQAIALTAPADFVSTLATDRLYDEAQSVQPNDLPINGATIDVTAGNKTYKLTAIYPAAVGSDFDLVVKYEAANVADTYQTYEANIAVIKALVAKFPEFRDAFDGVAARAVESSGRDYGSMLPMKEIK